MSIHREHLIPGLPVRLALGAVIDSTMGQIARMIRFVADESAPDGRRAVAADVDADGNERPQPIARLLRIAGGAARGATPCEIEFPDGARAVVDADKLEQAGELPEQEGAPMPSALANLARESADASLADVNARLSELARRVLAGDERDDAIDRRVSALETAQEEAGARARQLRDDPARRFVTAADLDHSLRNAAQLDAVAALEAKIAALEAKIAARG